MGRNKLERFRVNAERENVIEEGKPAYQNMKGNWANHFRNTKQLVLEIGCGNGDYTTGLAGLFPDKNFIGVDIKGARIWKGSSVAHDRGLTNVAFLRTQITQLDNFFEKGEVSEIWITFPDPRRRDKEEKHRLTNLKFLNIYKNLVKAEGCVHLKTDDDFLYHYTLDLLHQNQIGIRDLIHTENLYQSEFQDYHYGLTTTYEKRFLNEDKTIKYIRFKLT